MPLRRYHIVIFKERDGGSRNIHFRAWVGLAFLLFVAASLACNAWLWQEFKQSRTLQERLDQTERVLVDQTSQLGGLVNKITEVQSDLGRVQQFDTRLRLIMNSDGELDEAVGAARGEEFSRTYLPLFRQELMVRRMNTFLRQLSEDVNLEEVRQQELLHSLRDNRELLASMPSIWPVQGFLTSRFGTRVSPFTGRRDFHKGLDISARAGTPIVAPAAGTVIFAGVDGAYGNALRIRHGAGITTLYGHMQRLAVKNGQSVSRGTIIGYVGNTGRSTGPHLHYEVLLNGVNVSPLRYILN